ncbi:DMT family transporter [Microbacterium kunmingense]|jgi:probable blue pigment (indigoidine) exporter|uniref:DMT family transporter n=1 Tax=Microbacterium TaxID=33882 RepID=UPI002002AAAD|nr:DMT family transporter [Microbacterium kunmingense]
MSTPTAAGTGRRAPSPWRMLGITFAWGSCFVAISVGLQDAPLLWLAALRALVAGAALLILTVIRRAPVPREVRSWTLIGVLGVVNVAIAYAAMFGGTIGLTTGVASVLANVQPVLILLPAWWLYRERPSLRSVAAMLTGLAGLLLIVLPAGAGTGAWLSLTAAAAVTAGTLISRAVRADPFLVATVQLLLGGGILLVAAAIVEGPPVIEWTPGFVLSLLWMSLAGTAATTVAWYAETQRSRLDILTTWTILVPVFGIVLSVGLLQETQSVLGWTGTAIVIGSVALLTIPGRHADRASRRLEG